MIIDRYPIIRPGAHPEAYPYMIDAAVRRNRPKSIYFARPKGCEGPIKIGCSAEVGPRVQFLRGPKGERLELVATMAGGFKKERAIHCLFECDRLVGEWFSPSRELMAFIKALGS